MYERVGNAQRTHVIDLLNKAVVEGYLDLHEYEQRMITASSAATQGELVAQLWDLPAEYRWDPAQATRHPARQHADTLALLSLILGSTSLPLSLCFGVGGLPGAAALVLSILGMRSSRHYGMAIGGFVTGLLGVLLSIAMVLFWFGPWY
jgi:hypothetical protein